MKQITHFQCIKERTRTFALISAEKQFPYIQQQQKEHQHFEHVSHILIFLSLVILSRKPSFNLTSSSMNVC
ncbi:hypothetical protein MUG91_G57n66 [Manis pentadactyla]|nr:hypothetical protein MUG91_G57n66 [Manis pentadactyla]